MDDQEIPKVVREPYLTRKNSKISAVKDEVSSMGGDAEVDKPLTVKKSAAHDPLSELESQIIRTKHSLENWREIVLPVHSVLLWDKNWHPGAIIGGTTFLFISLWLLDPSVLTTVSILGLTATISDYLVPTVVATLFKTDSWTSTKERAYSEFCRTLVVYRAKVGLSCAAFYIMRSNRPKMFYGCTVLTLALLAWIGNSFNNLFLTYLLVTVLLLIPGMEHHGILHKYGTALTQKLSECAKMKMSHPKEQ